MRVGKHTDINTFLCRWMHVLPEKTWSKQRYLSNQILKSRPLRISWNTHLFEMVSGESLCYALAKRASTDNILCLTVPLSNFGISFGNQRVKAQTCRIRKENLVCIRRYLKSWNHVCFNDNDQKIPLCIKQMFFFLISLLSDFGLRLLQITFTALSVFKWCINNSN